MSFFSELIRVLKYTLKHLTRNVWQTVMVVVVLAITFLVAQLFVVVGVASNQVIAYFENQPQVTVFFKDEADEAQILQIKTELEKESRVEKVAYISKEQAVEKYRTFHEDDPALLEFVTPEILPASLEVSVNDVDYLKTVAAQFDDNQFVERVYYQPDLIEELRQWTNAFRQAGIALLAVMVFVASVIIILVIGNNITLFGHEIEVMRLVGAGGWYVRMPFVLDGMIFSVIGASIASAALYFLMPSMELFVGQLIASVQLFPDPVAMVIELWWQTVAVGATFTAIVSFASVWKYVRV